MTDTMIDTGRPDIEPGEIHFLVAVLLESHRWARAVLRRYNRRGPAGLHLEPGRLGTGEA